MQFKKSIPNKKIAINRHPHGNVPTIHRCCEHLTPIASKEPSFLDKLNEELAKQVYNNEDSLGTQGRLIAKEALYLVDGLKKGYGVTAGWNTPDTLTYQLMEFNLFEFSESKTEARLAAMTDLLIDKDKLQIRDENDFLKLAAEKTKDFNKEWLITERNLSISVGQNAAAYNRFMTEKDDFPYVYYQTAGDSRVRSQHAKLDGLVISLNDKTALNLWTPNGYGCRCEWLQFNGKPDKITSGKEITELMSRIDPKWKNSQFSINRGDLKQVFTKEQFYADTKGMSKKINDMTFDKYDLKSYNLFKSSLNPIKFDKTITEDNVNELFKETGKTKGNKKFMGFEDYFERKLILHEVVFKRHTKGHYIQEERHLLFPHIGSIVSKPDEVWLSRENNKNNQTLRYVKYYKNKAVVVLCEMNNTNLEIKTWFEMKEEDTTRSGLLIKRKG
ncbi:PBECR2 nuclease fold domain-containing protein [Empedobacter brevis]|uniref:PBECR2 nuclease fold domain-containing protein n=1 Tax=Empedobacter brevis TaxID=247 RepID=UPI002898C8F2|nr:PBECR2 nuclease fold domain-containing protein [Empedobacter brevis]